MAGMAWAEKGKKLWSVEGALGLPSHRQAAFAAPRAVPSSGRHAPRGHVSTPPSLPSRRGSAKGVYLEERGGRQSLQIAISHQHQPSSSAMGERG